MPQIIVTADRTSGREEAPVMLRERVNLADFESDHFAAQLVERLGWAVEDAHEVERQPNAGEVERQPNAGEVERPEAGEDEPRPAVAEYGDVAQPRASARVVTTAS